MDNTFWVDDHGSSEFGAVLLAEYSVSAPSISQDYVVSATGSRITLGGTRYGLRSISLPVDIYGNSPEDAEDKRSKLTAALSKGTVELALPDGGFYTCLLTDGGKKSEVDPQKGEILETTFTLVGYKHGPLETLLVSGSAASVSFFAAGTAQEMECRITATVGDYVNNKVTVPYPNSSVKRCLFPKTAVKSGDTIVIDGIEKNIYVNSSAGFSLIERIVGGWPKVKAGENTLTIPQPSSGTAFSQIAIEYYPIYM